VGQKGTPQGPMAGEFNEGDRLFPATSWEAPHSITIGERSGGQKFGIEKKEQGPSFGRRGGLNKKTIAVSDIYVYIDHMGTTTLGNPPGMGGRKNFREGTKIQGSGLLAEGTLRKQTLSKRKKSFIKNCRMEKRMNLTKGGG